MTEGNKQRTFYVKKSEINKVIDYFNKIGNIYNASIDLQNNGKVKIQPYNEKIEVMCDCQPKIINDLEEMLKND